MDRGSKKENEEIKEKLCARSCFSEWKRELKMASEIQHIESALKFVDAYPLPTSERSGQ